MQDMVEELDDLRRKKIFTESQLKEIVRRRRDFEYGLQVIPTKPSRYLDYVRYEVAVECLRKRRSKKLGWKTPTLSDYAGLRRLHKIFDRGTKRFRGEKKMWYQYIDFCIRSGSFRIFHSLLMRALKYHPREVNIWILAADHCLKKNKLDDTRKLLMRGLRCAPRSPKLWVEMLRLEVQVASRLWALRDNRETSSRETSLKLTDPWAPARLVLKRAMMKLNSRPRACSEFLAMASECIGKNLKVVRDDGALDEMGQGVEDLAFVLRSALVQHRQGVNEAKVWAEAEIDVAARVWRLWWEWERAHYDTAWSSIAADVTASGPGLAIRELASHLAATGSRSGGDVAAEALVALARAPRAVMDAETALAAFDALDACAGENSDAPASSKDTLASTASAILKRAAIALPSCARLQLLAWREKRAGGSERIAQIAAQAEAMEVEDALSLKFLSGASSSQRPSLESLLRGLGVNAPARPLIEAHLSEALVTDGHVGFRSAADEVRSLASRLWDLPKRRVEVLSTVLDVELRCCNAVFLAQGQVEIAKAAARLSALFEDILASLKDGDADKDEVWVRYLEFASRCSRWSLPPTKAGSTGIPSATDINWRAMKSVSSQSWLQERMHGLA